MAKYRLKQFYDNGNYVGESVSPDLKYLINLASNQQARGRKVKIEELKGKVWKASKKGEKDLDDLNKRIKKIQESVI